MLLVSRIFELICPSALHKAWYGFAGMLVHFGTVQIRETLLGNDCGYEEIGVIINQCGDTGRALILDGIASSFGILRGKYGYLGG